MKSNITPSPRQRLLRAVWLAFQASEPTGMGFLHTAAAEKLTEQNLDACIEPCGGGFEAYLDYCVGRMMKTQFKVNAKGEITISPVVPRYDYQSWGRTYKSATDIVDAVNASFE